MAKRKTTKEFIQAARQIHGDKYDYSRFEYVSAIRKSIIICPKHGEFLLDANHHISQGNGCSKCAHDATRIRCALPLSNFLERAKAIHGDKYDYSRVKYKNNTTPVEIICPEHGLFLQRPQDHLKGAKCFRCNGVKKLTIERFIQDSSRIHDGKYDYSQVSLMIKRHPIAKNIICKKHGAFDQDAYNHMRGNGCRKCKGFDKNKADLIKEFRKVHGEKYDYSLIDYVNTGTKINIVCSKHGVFEQMPSSHKHGCGCPSCGEYGFDSKSPAILYFLAFDKSFGVFWKIGVTNRTIEERFGIDANYIVRRHEWQFSKGENALRAERSVLAKFKAHKASPILFKRLNLGGETECFDLSIPVDDVLKHITNFVGRINMDL